MIKIWKLVEDTGIHTRLKFGDATNGYPSICEESKDGLGYFVTLEELRELFTLGADNEGSPGNFPTFDQWLASKGVKGE